MLPSTASLILSLPSCVALISSSGRKRDLDSPTKPIARAQAQERIRSTGHLSIPYPSVTKSVTFIAITIRRARVEELQSAIVDDGGAARFSKKIMRKQDNSL